MSSPPIVIPRSITKDRGIRALVMQWIHLQSRLAVIRKRVYWNNVKSSAVEKKRRKEQWLLIARILEIERSVIRLVGKATHHPDIWMSKKLGADVSRNIQLYRLFYQQKRSTKKLRGKARTASVQMEKRFIVEIRALTRMWMIAILQSTFPEQAIPEPIKMDPRVIVPRKVIRASKALVDELKTLSADPPVVPPSPVRPDRRTIYATLHYRRTVRATLSLT